MKELALITSLSCSLQCNYCRLSKDAQQLTNLNLQKENIQALKNGTFLNNIKQVFKQLELLPEEIEHIAFWGMEPTLTLKYIIENIQDWFKIFPNWNLCYFTTNGQQNIQDICKFAEIASQYSKSIFNIELQVSYDGPQFTQQNRQIKNKNYLHLFQDKINVFINDTKQKNFFLNIYPHGVITADIIQYLNNLPIDKLVEYFETQENYSFKNQLTQYFNFENQIHYNMEYPYNYTSKDGKNINQLLIKMLNSNYNILQEQAYALLYCYSANFIQNPISLLQPINKLITYCGNYTERLYLRYDGLIMQCENLFFKDKFKNYPLTKYNFFYNIKNNINEFFYFNYWETLNYKSNVFQYENIKNNIKILAKQKEIDPIYLQLNELTLNRHIRYIMFYNSCCADYYQLTNSALITPIAHIKFLCNGLGFLIDDYLNKILIKN